MSRLCPVCKLPITLDVRGDLVYCSLACKQKQYRILKLIKTMEETRK